MISRLEIWIKNNGKLKRQADKNKQRLEKVNESTKKTLEKSKQVKEIVNNLKPTKLIKNNYLISDDDINTINEYIENVDSNVSEIKSVNDLTNIIEDVEKDKDKTIQNKQTKIDKLNLDIETLNSKISTLNEIIEKLKNAWKKLLDFLIKKLYSKNKKDSIYGNVIIEMSDNEIFSVEDKEYIETTINEIENEPEVDYSDVENVDNFEI